MPRQFLVDIRDQNDNSTIIDLFAPGSKRLLSLLYNYAKKGYKEENLKFVIAMHDLNLKDNPGMDELEAIYSQYIKEDSPNQINIAADLRNSIAKAIEAGARDEALKLINEADTTAKMLIKTNDIPEIKDEKRGLPKEFEAAASIAVAEHKIAQEKIAKAKSERRAEEEQGLLELTYSMYLNEYIIPAELANTQPEFYDKMESILSAPMKRAAKIADPKNRHQEIAKARREADRIAGLAMGAAKAEENGTPEEALAARQNYLEALRSFVEQEKANIKKLKLSRQEIQDFERPLKAMEDRLKASKEAAERSMAHEEKSEKLEQPAPEKQKSPRGKAFKEKLNSAKDSISARISKKLAARQAQKAEPKKEEAMGLINSIIEKQTKGLDKRKANDLYGPLAEAVSRLVAAVKSPSATADDIEEKMRQVRIEEGIYKQELDAYFINKENLDKGRMEAASFASEVREEQFKKGNLVLEGPYDVKFMPNKRMLDPNQRDLYAHQKNCIYVSEDGHYFARDFEGVRHPGILKGMLLDDLRDLASKLREPEFKQKVNQAYVSAELENEKNKAEKRLLVVKEQAGSHAPLLSAFEHEREQALKKAKEATEPTPPTPTTTTRRGNKP